MAASSSDTPAVTMSSKVNEAEMQELLGFMSDRNPIHVRMMAMQYFKGVSGTEEGRGFMRSRPKVLSAVLDMLGVEVKGILKDALMTLVNMSTTPTLAMKLLGLESHPNLAEDLLLYVLNPESDYGDIAAMAISNFARTENIAKKFVKVMVECQESVGFGKVIEVFCQLDFNKKGAKLDYLGTFIWNLTQVRDARQYVLDKDHCVIQRLLPYTQFDDSLIRRGSAVGILYNCCFEASYNEWLLSDAVDILPRLLLPLAGPEEFDDEDNGQLPEELQYLEPTKTREPDPDIRRMLVDAVYQLCATKPCRLNVRGKNAYVILRELHQWETDPACNASIMNLIQVLLGDEPERGMENLHEVEIPKDVEVKLQAAYERDQAEIEEETKKLAEEEAKKLKEEETKKLAEEEAKKLKEEEAKKLAEEEAKKLKEEEEEKLAAMEKCKIDEKQ